MTDDNKNMSGLVEGSGSSITVSLDITPDAMKMFEQWKQEILKRLKCLGTSSPAHIGGNYVPIEDIKKLITWIERGTD